MQVNTDGQQAEGRGAPFAFSGEGAGDPATTAVSCPTRAVLPGGAAAPGRARRSWGRARL